LGRTRGGARSRGGPLGFLSGLAQGRGGGRKGVPINAKTVTGLLGAGAAGTALLRKRRNRSEEAPQPVDRIEDAQHPADRIDTVR